MTPGPAVAAAGTARHPGPLVAALVLGAVALLGLAGLRAAPGAVRFADVAPAFGGTAPEVTLPDYGVRGMHVVGYEHGASARLSLPIHNTGPLPITVDAVDLRAGVAPLLAVHEVSGLPLSVAPGRTGTVTMTAELANCRFFHERQVQNYAGLEIGFSVLGRRGSRWVAFDRPLMVHSPMIIGCPDRLLDRQADDRTDLVTAG